MPRGSAPGEHRGGRQKGTPNKKTELLQEAARKAAAIVDDARLKAKLIDAGEMMPTTLLRRSTSRQVLEKFRDTLAGMAAFYQPGPPTAPNANANLTAFLDCSDLAIKCASVLFDREEPKLRAVMVASAPPAEPAPADVTKLKLRDPVGAGRLYRQMIEGPQRRAG